MDSMGISWGISWEYQWEYHRNFMGKWGLRGLTLSQFDIAMENREVFVGKTGKMIYIYI